MPGVKADWERGCRGGSRFTQRDTRITSGLIFFEKIFLIWEDVH